MIHDEILKLLENPVTNQLKITKLVPCEIDLHPAFKTEWRHIPDQWACVRLSQLWPTNQWRVSVWGADDTGWERDFDPTQLEDAWSLFNRIVRIVDYAEFRQKFGMIHA